MQDLRQIELVGELLRKYARQYIENKDSFVKNERMIPKIRERLSLIPPNSKIWIKEKSGLDRIEEEISDFLDAEHFVFSDIGATTAEYIIEKYALPLNIGYYRRMILSGQIPKETTMRCKDAHNTGTKQMERQEVLDDNNGEGGVSGGRNTRRPTRPCAGDSAPVIRKAVALAGCVC